MKLAVIGLGVVGRHMRADIERAGHTCLTYDIVGEGHATRAQINTCDAAFVCVGTPATPEGEADLSAIAAVFAWLDVPVAIIRSTVPPGTTDQLPRAVFCPEFIGEGVNPPYLAMRQPPFVILGGAPELRALAADVFARLYNSECETIFVDAVTAEVCKYAENYFLALKVTWANELYDICQAVGADFPAMMNAVTHDYRIGRSHTHVYPDRRGFDGRCLPKDTAALLARVGRETAPLLLTVIQINEARRA